MSILQDISKRLLDVSNVPPEKRNDALMQVLIYIETVQYDMVLEQKNLIMSVIEDLIAENDAEQIAKSKLVFVEDVEEQIAPTKKTRAKKVVTPVSEGIGEDLPDTIEPFTKIKDLPEPIRKLIGLRRKEQGLTTNIDLDGFISSVINVTNTPEPSSFWDLIIIGGNLREFKKKFGNKGEKVDELIEFSELNEFVQGLTQPIASGDLPDKIDNSLPIKDLPEQIKKLAKFRNEQDITNNSFDLKNTLMFAFDWVNTPEGYDFWSNINDKGDLTEFKRIYGNKGKGVDAIIDELIGFSELFQLAEKQNATTVKVTTPTPVVAQQQLIFLKLNFFPPSGGVIDFELYSAVELYTLVISILNKLNVKDLIFNFVAVSDFENNKTKVKLRSYDSTSEMLALLEEKFDALVYPPLIWTDFKDRGYDKDRLVLNEEILLDAFPKKVAPVVSPKPVKVVTPKPVKVVAPKVVKTKVTKPKVKDDLSFLDDLENLF